MSISSCPRCAQQITIPEGASSAAKVRCPLCNAQYALAEVLVHAPPMLEIIEETTQETVDEWLAPPNQAESIVEEPREAEESAFELAPDVAPESEMSLEASTGGQPVEEMRLDEELTFDEEPAASADIEHDDLTRQEGDADTQIEDLDFGVSEPLARETPRELEPLETARSEEEMDFELNPMASDGEQTVEGVSAEQSSGEELELDFGESEGIGESDPRLAATVEFNEFDPNAAPQESPVFEAEDEEIPAEMSPELESSAADESNAEEPEIDFGEFEAVEAPDARNAATIDFEEMKPVNEPAAEEEMALDSGESQPDDQATEASTIAFEHRIPASAASDADEIELDFGEAAVSEAAPELQEEPAPEPEAKKSKKGKKKREPVDDDGGPRRRSLVGTLAGVVLGGGVGLLLALYLVLWVGKDYDFLKIGPTLAAWKIPLPAEYGKGAPAKVVAVAPPTAAAVPVEQPTPPPSDAQEPNPTPADTTPPTAAPADAVAASAAGSPDEPKPSAPRANAAAQPEPSATAAEPAAPPPEPATDEKPSLADEHPASTDAAAVAADEKPATEDKPSSESVGVTAAKPADLPPLDPVEMPAEAPAARSARPEEPLEETPKLDDVPLAHADADQPYLVDAPRYTSADLAKAMQDAGAASQRLQAVQGQKDEAALKRARAQFYLKTFAMAEVLTFTEGESDKEQSAPERQSVEQVMRQLAADKKRLDALKFNAARWLDFSKRTTPGIVTAGSVQSCEPLGKLFEIKLATGLSSDAPVVTVLHPGDPGLAAGDQALILGVIVDDPSERVVGYDGLEPTAIWCGMMIKLPAAK